MDAGLTLGRDEGSGVVLTGPRISRRHARIEARGRSFQLIDEGSKNGCHRNGSRVESALLHEHDVLRVGDSLAVVVELGEGSGSGSGEVRAVFPGVLAGPRLACVARDLVALAPTALNVVLVGEIGTGKHTFARALHGVSGRRGRLVHVLGAALVGLTDGSPLAHVDPEHDTLLIDEPGELPDTAQTALLDVLRHAAEGEPLQSGLRVLSTSHSPLHVALERGSLRPELFARLSGAELKLPPLRARREEILPIFTQAFAAQAEGREPLLDVEAAERLCLYDFPFNVRELAQAAGVLAIRLGAAAPLGACELDTVIGDDPSTSDKHAAPLHESEADRLASLLETLRGCSGNVTEAARLLGISRSRAYRLMRGRLDLDALRGASGRDDH